MEPVEDCGAEQEVANLRGLPGQNLVGQVVDDEPVAAGERLDEVGDLFVVRDAAQGECGELQAGDPALRAVLQRVHVGCGELQPHHLVEELPRLGWGEAQVGGAQLSELSATAQPGQRQRRIGPGRHDQMQLIREMVEQEGHRLVDLGRSDHVIVVEHHDPLRPRLLFTGSGEVVDERSQGFGSRSGGHRLEDCRLDLEFGGLQGSHQVGHEAGQVVVAVIEGEPADPRVSLPMIEFGEPVAEQGGLAEAGRSGH